ncbi:hypothetical protein [Tsukamurella spumae]|uniref:Uncharacterized protein n=1 Tax=Tsukamurella spumae TaxID=44753 RepID=A0A846X4S2_9ACTN|nr:hypothetical protein [Tsukamurella spumae]NKY19526.1 hypothetical protein [Tsukamurella spumae]
MKIKFTESRKGYHVADTDADLYLGQVVQHSTWQTRNKRDRVYWTALVGALGPADEGRARPAAHVRHT